LSWNPAHRGRRVRRRQRWACGLTLAVFAACASSGPLQQVSPAIQGRLHGDALPNGPAELVLRIVQRDTASLVAQATSPLEADGRFSFPSLERLVAGKQQGREYRAFLHLMVGGRTRVIWRAQYSRNDLSNSVDVDLECDLSRAARIGQPCWLDDPLENRWFLVEGERTYRRLCVRCHGIDGGGEIGVEAGERPKPPDLREIALRRGGEFDRTAVAEWIEGSSAPAAHGNRNMPVWGEELEVEYQQYANPDALVGATLDPLVAYLEHMQVTKAQ